MAPARRVRQVLVAGGMLVVAGCQTTAVPGGPTAEVAATPSAPATDATTDIANLQAPAFDTLPPAPPPPAINDDPTQVMGLPTLELSALLGAPRFVRRDLAAEVWQYRTEGCVLDVFVYDRETYGGGEVVHYEVRPSRLDGRPLATTAQRSCFARLLRQRDTAAS